MNDVLAKCIEELAEENPSVPYVRGMLETLLAMNEPKVPFYPSGSPIYPLPSVMVTTASTMPKDEGALLDASAAAKIAALKGTAQMT